MSAMPPKERISSFELLRILAMLMIVAGHAIAHGGIQHYDPGSIFSLNEAINIVVSSFGQVGVSLFIIISSYFLCDAEGIHSKKIVLLAVQTLSVSIVLCVLFRLFSIESFGPKQIIKCLLTPFWQGSGYWFIRVYINFYLLVPIFQKLVKQLSVESLRKIFIVTSILIPVFRFCFFQEDTATIGDFTYIFLAVAYLKKSGNSVLERKPELCMPPALVLYLFFVFALKYLSRKYGIPDFSGKLTDRELPCLFLAFSLFYFAKKYWQFKSRLVNAVAKTAVGVYVLHENPLFYYNAEEPFLFCRLLKVGEKSAYGWYGCYLLLVVAAVFTVCSLIEGIRICLFDRLLLGKDRRLEALCSRFDAWYRL